MKVRTAGVFARIVGYYSKVSNWNQGKKSEWKDRTIPTLKDKTAKAA